MWVVLSEDAVEFYKKKTDRSPKGLIPLKGATLISPCQEFGNRTVRKSSITAEKSRDWRCENCSLY